MRVNKHTLVESKIFGITGGNQGTTFQFQDQPYLRGKKITGIESFIVNEVPISPTGATVVSEAQYEKAFLTLYTTNINNPDSLGEWIQNVPLVLLHRVQNGAGSLSFVLYPFLLVGQTILWDKSYIRLTSSLANTSDVSFLFSVYFE